MGENVLKGKSKKFALDIIEISEEIPDNHTGKVIKYQLVKSGTSVGANYRAACRAKSQADFIAKMGIVEEETDESMFWLEVLVEAGIFSMVTIKQLYKDADEILAMSVA